MQVQKRMTWISLQFEMWQAGSFDGARIKKELEIASGLGLNTIRVYLHDQIFNHEKESFLNRIDQFLSIAEAQNLRTILVLFDDCHRPDPKYGSQPLPIKGVHNSVWKQSPVINWESIQTLKLLRFYRKSLDRVLKWSKGSMMGQPLQAK